jgi:hypothetical protein
MAAGLSMENSVSLPPHAVQHRGEMARRDEFSFDLSPSIARVQFAPHEIRELLPACGCFEQLEAFTLTRIAGLPPQHHFQAIGGDARFKPVNQ